MKILITGAKSFIGTNFRKFSHFIDIEEISLLEKNPENIDFRGYEIVIHLAAIVHQSRKISENIYFLVNRDLCLRTAEYAKRGGVRQFVFLSTLKVYGQSEPASGLRNENSECFPEDSYSKSKYEAEEGLLKLNDENFKVSIIRPSIVYGYGVKANMLNLVKLISFCPILPFKGIENRRNFIYIENLISLIDRIIDRNESGVFIAKDEKSISTTELIQLISRVTNRKVILFSLPKLIIRIVSILFPGNYNRLYRSFEFDDTQTKMTLNYIPPYTTEEGIDKWIKSYDN
jgi:nucleoside-diphosphate-sugar epimerase